MNITKLSIILPVYNTAKYLNQCIDSILNQSLKEFELICINDGSTDNSLNILKEYASKDNRITIIDKENGGQGLARNIAIEKAIGEYLSFIDSDDWIEPTMLKELYHAAKQNSSEIVLCEHKVFDIPTNVISQPEYTRLPIPKIFDQRSFQSSEITDFLFSINTGPCNKIFKTEFVNSIGAKFAEGLLYEDILFVFKCLINAKVINIVRRPLYIIRYLRPGSETSYRGKKQFDIFEVIQLLDKEIYKDEIPDAIKIKYQDYKVSQFFYHFNLLDPNYKKEFWNRILSELNKTDSKSHTAGKYKFLFLHYKIRFLEKLKVIAFKVLGKHTFKFLKLYRAVQGRLIK